MKQVLIYMKQSNIFKRLISRKEHNKKHTPCFFLKPTETLVDRKILKSAKKRTFLMLWIYIDRYHF
jgi:hypothetical protein